MTSSMLSKSNSNNHWLTTDFIPTDVLTHGVAYCTSQMKNTQTSTGSETTKAFNNNLTQQQLINRTW